MEAAHRQGVRAGAPSCQGSVFTLLKALRTPHLGVFREVSPARAVDHIPLCPVHEAPCRSLEHVVSFRRHPIARRCDVSLLREPYVVLPLDKGANWAQRRSTTRRSPHRAWQPSCSTALAVSTPLHPPQGDAARNWSQSSHHTSKNLLGPPVLSPYFNWKWLSPLGFAVPR